MKGFIKQLLRFGFLSFLTVAGTQAFAAGYKMEFQSVSVLADGGDAAVVEDAGTNWYNSAGLVYLPQQLVGSAIELFSRTTYTGSIFAPSATFPLTANFSDQGSAHSFQNITLPALHYSLPFKNNKFAFGLSVVPAWGLAENYGQSSFVRYQLTRIYTKTIDIAPSLAWKINNKWSLGAGPDFNYLSLQSRFNGNIGFPTFPDAISRVSADAWNTGWHMGALLRLDDYTRFGLNYRSKIVMNLKGYSALYGAGLANPETNAFTFNWVLPPTTSLSAYRDLSPCWALMGTLAYDQWSTLRSYSINNYMSPTGLTPVSLPQGFRDTLDISVGAHYRFSDKLLLRGSLKYEPTPTGDQHRDINFPDGNKLGVNLGGRYQFNKKLALDLIYAHVFTKTVPIRPEAVVYPGTVTPITGVVLDGHSATSIDLIGAQIVWNIC